MQAALVPQAPFDWQGIEHGAGGLEKHSIHLYFSGEQSTQQNHDQVQTQFEQDGLEFRQSLQHATDTVPEPVAGLETIPAISAAAPAVIFRSIDRLEVIFSI